MLDSLSLYASIGLSINKGAFVLSFELSAIDLILVIAVIVLLVLYITKLSTKTATEEKLNKAARSLKTEEEKKLPSRAQTDSPSCPHVFGYLRKLGRETPIPDECLSCSRIMECFGSSE